MTEHRNMGDWLVQRGLLSPANLEKALALQRHAHGRFEEILLEHGFVTENDVTACFAAQYHMPIADLSKVKSKPEARHFVAHSFALTHLVLPVKVTETTFECIIADPVDLPFIEHLRTTIPKRLVMSLAPATALFEAIARAYHVPLPHALKHVGAIDESKHVEIAKTPSRRKPAAPQNDRAELLSLLSEVA